MSAKRNYVLLSPKYIEIYDNSKVSFVSAFELEGINVLYFVSYYKATSYFSPFNARVQSPCSFPSTRNWWCEQLFGSPPQQRSVCNGAPPAVPRPRERGSCLGSASEWKGKCRGGAEHGELRTAAIVAAAPAPLLLWGRRRCVLLICI